MQSSQELSIDKNSIDDVYGDSHNKDIKTGSGLSQTQATSFISQKKGISNPYQSQSIIN